MLLDLDAPDEQIKRGRLIENWEEYQDSEEDEEEESVPQCRAETNSGSQCPNDAKHPAEDPVVCVNHRHKADDVGN